MRIMNPALLLGDAKFFIVNASDQVAKKPIANANVEVKDKKTGQTVATGTTNEAGGVRFPVSQFKSFNDLEIRVTNAAGYKNFRMDVNPKAVMHTYWVSLEPKAAAPTGGGTTTGGNLVAGGGKDESVDTGGKPKFAIKNLKTGYVIAGVVGLTLLIIAFTAASKSN